MWNTIVRNKAMVGGFVAIASLISLAEGAVRERGRLDKRTEKEKEIAKETVLRVLKAAKAKDLDEIMKLVDVPWYSDGNKIIKSRDDLKKDLKSNWVDFVARGRALPTVIFRVATYEEVREILKESKRQLADQVLVKNDWVVFVQGKPEEKANRGMFFVREREGKGRIIGVAQ